MIIKHSENFTKRKTTREKIENNLTHILNCIDGITFVFCNGFAYILLANNRVWVLSL